MTCLSTSAPVMQTIGLRGAISWESSAQVERALDTAFAPRQDDP